MFSQSKCISSHCFQTKISVIHENEICNAAAVFSQISYQPKDRAIHISSMSLNSLHTGGKNQSQNPSCNQICQISGLAGKVSVTPRRFLCPNKTACLFFSHTEVCVPQIRMVVTDAHITDAVMVMVLKLINLQS